MGRKEREQIGPFVITGAKDLDPRGIACAECGKLLTTYDPEHDRHERSPEELLAIGAVPVPNFGWFCSQACGDSYERATGFAFQRDSSGQIAYYDEE